MRRPLTVLTALLAIWTALPVHAQDGERWRGAIDLAAAGAAGELEFFVTFDVSGDEPTATLSIPAQGLTDAPVTNVVYTDVRIEFTLAASAAVFQADRDGEEAAGHLLQQGREIPLGMRLLGAGENAGPARPQTPQPPFPYSARDVTYTNPAEGNTLAGTLTLPAGDGPHPAALLITGSGGQDRDETIFDHKPFWVIADYLSRRGIAVLRVDDRGIGGSDGARADLTSADFAGDVKAGVAFLREQSEIDMARVGLIGHSEGGLIAPMVAAEDPEIAFIVMLAGTGVDGRQVLELQNELLLRAAGASDDYVEAQLERQRPLWDAMAAGADEETLDPLLTALLEHQLQGVTGEARDQTWEVAWAQAKAQATSAWFQYFLSTDPAQFLEQTQAPVLALNGTLDLQVDAEQNLPAIEAALARAGNDDVTVVRLDRLNHLFQTATTGSVAEYGAIEETFAPEALELMGDWILNRLGMN